MATVSSEVMLARICIFTISYFLSYLILCFTFVYPFLAFVGLEFVTKILVSSSSWNSDFSTFEGCIPRDMEFPRTNRPSSESESS